MGPPVYGLFFKISVFDVVAQEIEPGLVPAALESGFQEDVDDPQGRRRIDHPRAEGQDIGVVVAAGQAWRRSRRGRGRRARS